MCKRPIQTLRSYQGCDTLREESRCLRHYDRAIPASHAIRGVKTLRCPKTGCIISHLRQTLRRPKNPGCLGCVTHNLPPQYTLRKKGYQNSAPRGTLFSVSAGKCAPCYLSQAALWAYSGTGSETPPGHTQILRPHNLWHISCHWQILLETATYSLYVVVGGGELAWSAHKILSPRALYWNAQKLIP